MKFIVTKRLTYLNGAMYVLESKYHYSRVHAFQFDLFEEHLRENSGYLDSDFDDIDDELF